MKKTTKTIKMSTHKTSKNAFLSILTMTVMGIIGIGSLAACDSESPAESLDKEQKTFEEYWGKSKEYLNGIWVSESEKDNPTAGYVIIENGEKFNSVNLISQNRAESGSLLFYGNGTHGVQFGSVNTYSLEWLNNSHTRLGVHSFNSFTYEVDPDVADIWIKVPTIPSGWN